MLPLFPRVSLCALFVLQTLQPALAWNWYAAEEPCCGEVTWDCCESAVVVEGDACGCEAEPLVVDECGCGSEPVEAEASEPAQQPEPAQTNKPQAGETKLPQTETPQPALDESEVLPPAPINVPTTPPAADTESNEVFPGPAAEPAVPTDTEPATSTPTHPTPTDTVPPTTTPAADTATPPSDNAGGLFEEPAASASPETEPATATPAPATETAPAESTPVDDVFGEPSPPAEESTDNAPAVEEESVEVESTETKSPESESTEQPATDPLDDLFGPSSAVEQPELNRDVVAASDEFRPWTNRRTDFACQGRLIRMTTEGVFVAQSSGALVAIAFSQLSDADLAFVRDQVQAQRAQLAQEAMQTQVVSH